MLAASGCHAPRTTIASEPEKIQVLLDGRSRGRTPIEVQARYPGIRSVEWLPPPPESPGGPARPGVVRLANLRPAPPGWLFPLDFPLDLASRLMFRSDLRLEATLPEPEEGAPATPTAREIADMARRGRILGLRRGE